MIYRNIGTFLDILVIYIYKVIQDSVVVAAVNKRMKRNFRFPNKKRKYLEDSAEKKRGIVL